MNRIVVNEEMLHEVVERLVAAVSPERIILFGSRGRGDARDDSDVDLLLIGASGDRRGQEVRAYQALGGLRCPADILWYTPQEVNGWAGVRNHVVSRALREGRVLYERRP
jgi:predicted nucleotidyltransferase